MDIRLGFLTLALIAGGCGDDDAPPMTMTDGGTDSGTDAETMGGDDIIAVAEAAGFTQLLAQLETAGLTETLQGTGPFTVFAPTDEAFAAAADALGGLEQAEITEALTYHVIEGAAVPSTAIPAFADTVAGYSLIFGTEGGVTVNGAQVTQADVEASNGVIHVIDTVLLPPDLPTLAGLAGLSSLVEQVTTAELVETLQGEGPFTVFAPTNEAFGALAEVPTGEALTSVLLYHVAPGEVPSSAIIETPTFVPSASNNEFGNALDLVAISAEGAAQINGAAVVLADVQATNGTVHVIDQVLLPPTVADMAGLAGLTELLTVVGAAAPVGDTPVAEALGTLAPITVFAPTNDAFAAISDVAESLTPEQVRDVLLYHVVGGDAPVLSGDLTDGEVPTLLEANVTITADPPTVAGAGNDTPSNVVTADIDVTNGVVHVIDQVLLPAL